MLASTWPSAATSSCGRPRRASSRIRRCWVDVELALGAPEDPLLAEAIGGVALSRRAAVRTRVRLVPWGSLRRSEYKSKLVER